MQTSKRTNKNIREEKQNEHTRPGDGKEENETGRLQTHKEKKKMMHKNDQLKQIDEESQDKTHNGIGE